MTTKLVSAAPLMLTVACLSACSGSNSTSDPSVPERDSGAGSNADAGQPHAGDNGADSGPGHTDGEADAQPPTDGSSGNSDTGSPSGTTALTGTLGKLGSVKAIVSSQAIYNSGETLVYLSSANLTCAAMQSSRWLGAQPAGSQVVEIVIKGKPSVGQTVNVPPGEVNYAAGGKSSSYETNADSGTITFTRADPNGVIEGTVSAKYSDGSSVSGTFHADFCANGQQF